MRTLKKDVAATCCAVGVIVILCLLGAWLTTSGPSEEAAEAERYCEMVSMFKEDPTVGWPDFHGTYDRLCDGEDVK